MTPQYWVLTYKHTRNYGIQNLSFFTVLTGMLLVKNRIWMIIAVCQKWRRRECFCSQKDLPQDLLFWNKKKTKLLCYLTWRIFYKFLVSNVPLSECLEAILKGDILVYFLQVRLRISTCSDIGEPGPSWITSIKRLLVGILQG